MANRKTEAEWDRIELEYLAGEVSVREIADRFCISDTAIRKRAKAEGWARVVRRPKSANLAERGAAAAPRAPDEPVDAPAIAERGRQLVVRMLDELDTVTSRMGELEELIEEETSGDRDPGRREGMMKAVSLGNRALTVKTLAAAFKTLNEASAPQGKKAAAQQAAKEIGGGSRFAPITPPRMPAAKLN